MNTVKNFGVCFDRSVWVDSFFPQRSRNPQRNSFASRDVGSKLRGIVAVWNKVNF